ncbi:unnamed protein product [Kuraishia capsulata CBS 1993]|uniref:Uncharacterized protein n=1 Tax=Kuraishia capsulata CBS 1993 TaxID=1382522 RepID=W6MW29_9ASCO|nr:uncharacterized protein KUCA_T00002809001 [Kuraishia capsulata CBS 1993]CDK26835.1 unnamed protein product [Kuraishia capsulata CBS 1993]
MSRRKNHSSGNYEDVIAPELLQQSRDYSEFDDMIPDVETLKGMISSDENVSEIAFSDDDEIIGMDEGDDEEELNGDDIGPGEDIDGDSSAPPSFAFQYEDAAESSDEENDPFDSEFEDEEDIPLRELMREASNFKSKARKRKRKGGFGALMRKLRKEGDMDPEIKKLLSDANEAFVRSDFKVATNLYTEVIRKDSKNFSAYKTLGEICRMQNRLNTCSNLWVLAAHFHPWDHEFWSTNGELSTELGHLLQAIYCYGKAITAATSQWNNQKGNKKLRKTLNHYIFQRAILYNMTGKYRKAAENLQGLLAQEFDENVLRELAEVLMKQKRVNEAISLYTKQLDDAVAYRLNKKRTKGASLTKLKWEPNFDWSALNILAELYVNIGSWSTGLKTVRNVSRWIQHREDQTFWSEVPDDSEFDVRRFENPKFQQLSQQEKVKDYEELPVDMRVRIGIFRLNLKNYDEALRHFRYILRGDPERYSDLLWDIGSALEVHHLHSDALSFFTRLYELRSNHSPDLFHAMAKCYREIENYEDAAEMYWKVLEEEPDNLEAKTSLAEILFLTGDSETATKLFLESKKQRAQAIANGDVEVEDDEEKDTQNEDDNDGTLPMEGQALIRGLQSKGKPKKTKKKKEAFTAVEWEEMEQRSKSRVHEKFTRANRLLPGVAENDPFAVNAWLDLAGELVEIFAACRVFYSSDRAKKFAAGLRKRQSNLDIDQRLLRMTYLEEEMLLNKELTQIKPPEREFRGVPFAEWYNLFLRYSLMLAKWENAGDDAMLVQEMAKHINVFNTNKETESVITLVGLSIGLMLADYDIISSQLRILQNLFQFSPKVLKTFVASYSTGQDSALLFADTSNQKYILRQLKAYDSLKEHKKITGMATITNKQVDTSKAHPILAHVYSTFLFVNRSYQSSLAYELRTVTDYKKDPTVMLTIALAHIHRSMQRLTMNRHFQIVQGITYLMEYRRLRIEQGGTVYEDMECAYNFGRSFHQLGLLSIAVPFYEQVLAMSDVDPKYDLKMDTAYNLFLIYNYNGNPVLANQIMNKYLTV